MVGYRMPDNYDRKKSANDIQSDFRLNRKYCDCAYVTT